MEGMGSIFNASAMQIVQIHHYAENLHSSEVDKLYQDDAVWIISSSFIIFTMHSGFGLLESGSVSAKDEVNIMVKNVVDVVFGGLSYWSCGFGFSYGDYEPWRNPYIGFGKFFYDPTRDYDSRESINQEGWSYASFLFQLSLATTASTIVSGAVAERAKLKSYILLGCIVILIQALPAHWVWDKEGVFYKKGVVDFAGCSAVHMVGGIIGLIATVYLKPRRNRFNEDSVHQMSSPTNALLGTFLLWWGWFGINAGSVWGITGGRWRLGARAAVATIMASIGGGATAITISFVKTKKLQVNFLINGILSSIVSITAICAVSRPWHALVIGSISSVFSIAILPVLDRLHIDDPVGIVPIHLTSSIWGMIAVGIFCEQDKYLTSATNNMSGLLYSWSFDLLLVQLLCTFTILLYSAATGFLALFLISKSPLGLRVTDYEEQIGADVIEHGLAGTNVVGLFEKTRKNGIGFQNISNCHKSNNQVENAGEEEKSAKANGSGKIETRSGARNVCSTALANGNGATPNGNGNVLHHRNNATNNTNTTNSNGAGPPKRNSVHAFNNQVAPLAVSSTVTTARNAPSTGRRAESTAIEMEGGPLPTAPVLQEAAPVENVPTSSAAVQRQPSWESKPSSAASRKSISITSATSVSTGTATALSVGQSESRPSTVSATSLASRKSKNSTLGKFVKAPAPRALSPPMDNPLNPPTTDV
ncbi:Protein CBR-AMT-3 [Caenorhabditis briggsae]|uniref:Ammonium transporter n=1 Tax=Caenorhabditis briggsae TaxID=6238 RepID=A8WN92_CAEBR|nr:Protein CBR-AMT-3 [Caenorhabditis briggsae]CAP21946.2 Protein CBR-AMT-3 [Caenorhabditis briggsae]